MWFSALLCLLTAQFCLFLNISISWLVFCTFLAFDISALWFSVHLYPLTRFMHISDYWQVSSVDFCTLLSVDSFSAKWFSALLCLLTAQLRGFLYTSVCWQLSSVEVCTSLSVDSIALWSFVHLCLLTRTRSDVILCGWQDDKTRITCTINSNQLCLPAAHMYYKQ